MNTLKPDFERWFAEEVQVHEGALRAWLRSSFPSLSDLDDIVQESYLRLWRAHGKGEVHSPRAFLFATARNAALDLFRRRQVVRMEQVEDSARLSVLEEGPGVVDTVSKKQEIALLTQAIQNLPDRCRQVLTLRKIYGLTQKEIAARLGIAEHTVEVQVANGMRRCADYLARYGLG